MPESRDQDARFQVVPVDIANWGILLVDHHAQGCSGHGGNCRTCGVR